MVANERADRGEDEDPEARAIVSVEEAVEVDRSVHPSGIVPILQYVLAVFNFGKIDIILSLISACF